MKREELLRILRHQGCVLKREGANHSLWMNPLTGAIEGVPRHREIDEKPGEKDRAGFVEMNAQESHDEAAVTIMKDYIVIPRLMLIYFPEQSRRIMRICA